MPEETATQTEQVAAVTPQEIKEASIRGAEGPTEFQGTETLFGEVAPTDAELRGEGTETSEGDTTTANPKPTEDETKPEEKKEDPVKEPEKKEEPKKEEPKEDGKEITKPPEGYVPLAALREERTQRKQLADDLANLRAELQALKTAPKAGEEPEFKILSEAEFNQLVEDAPVEAIKYTKKLQEYEAKQAKVNEVKKQTEAQEQWEQSVVGKTIQRIETEVPGIYDDEATINSELTAFASEQGLDPVYLSVFSDPRTRIIPPGQKNPIILGEGAAELISMLYKVYSAKGKGSREAIEKELRTAFDTELSEKLAAKEAEVTEKITKEVMGKLKEQPTYRSLGDAPGSGDTPLSGPLTEAQIAKMSPEELRRALGG